MVALLPALIIGVVILIAVGRIRLPKTSAEKERDAEVDAKGFAGVVVDDVAGAGAAAALQQDVHQKGVVGYVHDGLFGSGTYEKLTTEIDAIEANRKKQVNAFWSAVEGAYRGTGHAIDSAARGASEFAANVGAAAQRDSFAYGVAALGGPIGLAAAAVAGRQGGAQ